MRSFLTLPLSPSPSLALGASRSRSTRPSALAPDGRNVAPVLGAYGVPLIALGGDVEVASATGTKNPTGAAGNAKSQERLSSLSALDAQEEV